MECYFIEISINNYLLAQIAYPTHSFNENENCQDQSNRFLIDEFIFY